MADLVSWHSMLIEMHGGMLALATVCILATVVARIHQRIRRTSERYGVLWPLDSFMGTLARYAEPTAYLAGIGGVVGLIVSAIVGIYVWPIEAITTNALGLRKVMFSIFATEFWIVFVIIRAKYGENLWKNGGMAAVYAFSGIFGFLFTVLAGCLGARMAGKPSVVDPIYALLGMDPETFWIVGLDLVPVLVVVAFVEIASVIAIFLHRQR